MYADHEIPSEAICPAALRIALQRAAEHVGKRIARPLAVADQWEGESALDRHLATRSDLEATGDFIARCSGELLNVGTHVRVAFINEELPFVPHDADKTDLAEYLTVILDPIDGSKDMESYRSLMDLSVPQPTSAICASAKFGGRLLAGVVYCFDTREAISVECAGGGRYLAFSNSAFLAPEPAPIRCSSQWRAVVADYANHAVGRLGALKLALEDGGLRSFYGGATGSSALDIVNVVRGRFCLYADLRGLYELRCMGASLKWYDVSAAVMIAKARGLSVVITRPDGSRVEPDALNAFDTIALIVARPERLETVLGVIRGAVSETFAVEEDERSTDATRAA